MIIFTNNDLLTGIMPFVNGGYYNYDRLLYLAGQTDIVFIKEPKENRSEAGVWFTLDGRRLTSRPAANGIYIRNGKKYIK